MVEGDVESGSLMAGQSVGLVTREQTTREIVAELIGQAVAALAAREAEAAPGAAPEPARGAAQ